MYVNSFVALWTIIVPWSRLNKNFINKDEYTYVDLFYMHVACLSLTKRYIELNVW